MWVKIGKTKLPLSNTMSENSIYNMIEIYPDTTTNCITWNYYITLG